MDAVQLLVPLLSAVVGGVLVIVGERLRSRDASNEKRAETIVLLYTDFFVSFQMSLHYNEAFWFGVVSSLEGTSSFKESDKAHDARLAAETAFRESAWRLRLRERDRQQQDRIETLARAFDEEIPDQDHFNDIAWGYKDKAKQLREAARVVVNEMQLLHGSTLGLFESNSLFAKFSRVARRQR